MRKRSRSCSTGSDRRYQLVTDLGCSPNAVIVYDYLVSRGLRDFQAAAVVGNLQLESGINPRLEVMDTNGLPSRGIAMWQPPRWQNLLAFAAGRDPFSLSVQLEFLWYELPGAGLNALLASTTIEDATVIFQDKFENPRHDLAHTDRRIAYAKSALYACPAIKPPPEPPRRVGIVAATMGAAALVAAAGYGIYKAVTSRKPEPEPVYLPPPRFRRIEPTFRRMP